LRDFEDQVGKGFLSETLPETNLSVAIGVFNEKLFLKIDQTAKKMLKSNQDVTDAAGRYHLG